MGRKNLLTDLTVDAALPSGSDPAAEPASHVAPTALGARGVVGAMSRSLEAISAERDAAKAIGRQMAAGFSVVEIETRLIDASFVADRMPDADAEHDGLVSAIREHGQQVPVLLRPHPEEKGRFQIAYGHRRVRAASSLGRPVRAVVRDLSDEELVVAQGQENSARKDLSFIERACFAATLEDRRFTRDVIMSALTVDKTELSRLLSLRRSIPPTIVAAIGPAPKTGRRRWLEFAQRLDGAADPDEALKNVLSDEAFVTATSDERFLRLNAALTPSAKSSEKAAQEISDPEGRRFARVDRGVGRVTISVDERAAPDFGAYLVDRLPELFKAFSERAGR
jgi:ParB family chromosome partitioning protein